MASDQDGHGKPTLLMRNLERLLTKHNLDGAAIARLTGGRVSAADVSRVLNGKTADPGFSKIEAMADAMGESTEAFRANPEAPEQMEPSLDAFVKSGLAPDLKPEELVTLASTRWASGPPPSPAAWWHILQAVRLTRGVE